MIRVVVEKKEPLYIRLEGQLHDVVHAAVAPAGMMLIFLRIILRIHDQHVGAAQKGDHLVLLASGKVARRGVSRVLRAGRMVMSGMLLVIREESNRTGRSKDAIADTDAGVIGKPGANLKLTDGETEVLQLLDLDVGRHLAQADGKERTLHLAGQHVLQAVARSFVAENAEMVLRLIDRQKKRQALDVVPVRVRQQQRQVQRLVVELRGQLASEQPQADRKSTRLSSSHERISYAVFRLKKKKR